jgi:D-methionine transport system ATP-binding protein
MRIELPGRYEDNVVPIGFLREQGLQVDVVDDEAQRPGRPQQLHVPAQGLVKETAK